MRAGQGHATLLVLLLSLIGAAAVSRSLLAQAASPRASVPAPSHDFGTVRKGERLTHTFTMLNEGAAPLTILRIQLTAPGTKTSFRKTIPPGESGRITMEWETSALQGEFEAEAVVHLDDPHQKKVSLSLRAVVKAALEFAPSPAVFFSTYRDETPERTVQIVNNEAQPLTITGAESPSDHYDVSVSTVRSGFAYDVRIRVRPGVPFGRYVSEPIYLRTDRPERRLQLFANLFVKPDFYAAPEDVNFGTIRLEGLTGDSLKQSVTLTNRAGSVEIQRIESDIRALNITRTPPSGSSQRFRIDIAVAPDKVLRGPLAGTLRIVTTNPAIPELIIPVRGEVQ
jgi:Protein of unknown function (DUF1573)